jgi:rhodanese-related sulfurtransferase
MGRFNFWSVVILAVTCAATPSLAAGDDLALKMNKILIEAVDDGHWQVSADEINMWIETKAKDFLVVDVSVKEKAYNAGHIPGAIYIPYYKILLPENLKKLPRDKKIVLMCTTGQLQNIPVVPLRLLGYEVYSMPFGYASWIKDSDGADQMKSVIERANKKNYPLEKTPPWYSIK